MKVEQIANRLTRQAQLFHFHVSLSCHQGVTVSLEGGDECKSMRLTNVMNTWDFCVLCLSLYSSSWVALIHSRSFRPCERLLLQERKYLTLERLSVDLFHLLLSSCIMCVIYKEVRGTQVCWAMVSHKLSLVSFQEEQERKVYISLYV